jgi:ParB/RepB/Spo0J family partition protein
MNDDFGTKRLSNMAHNAESSIDRYQAFPLALADVFYDLDFNSRRPFTLMSLASLADSIRATGLQSPVQVQPIEDTKLRVPYKWRLLAGFRRFAVFRDILREQIIHATVLRGLTDEQAVMVNFEENSERSQLTPLEEALWLQKHFNGKPLRDISKIVHKDTRWVHQRQRLASMPPEVQSKFAAGLLSLLDIDSISKLEDVDQQIKTANLIIEAKRARDTGRVTRLRTARKFRPRKSKKDIWAMNGRLMQIDNTHSISRFLAWTTGDVSDQEIEEEFAQVAGRNYIRRV